MNDAGRVKWAQRRDQDDGLLRQRIYECAVGDLLQGIEVMGTSGPQFGGDHAPGCVSKRLKDLLQNPLVITRELGRIAKVVQLGDRSTA